MGTGKGEKREEGRDKSKEENEGRVVERIEGKDGKVSDGRNDFMEG